MDPKSPDQPPVSETPVAQPIVPATPPPPPAGTQWSGQNLSANNKPSSGIPVVKIYNVGMLIFLVLIVVEWVFPVGDPGCNYRGCPSSVTLPGLLAGPTFFFGWIAGIMFGLKTWQESQKSGKGALILGGIVGLGGAGFLIIVGSISSLVGSLRGQPPSS